MMTMCLPLFTVALAASVPSAPQSLTSVSGDGQIALVWFAPENDGGAAITGYQVSIDGGETWTDTGLITSFTYNGLTGGKLYTFMVRAMNSAGCGEEAIANAKPSGSGAAASPTQTPAPTDGLGSQFDSWFSSTATPAPTGGGTGTGSGGGQGVGPGGGGQGTGEGQKPGDQQQNPPQPPPYEPPPKVDPPPPEENIPIEIDPADVTEKPLKPKKEKVQEAVTVWTITADGTQPWFMGGASKMDFTLEFRATRVDGTMYGNYAGEGTLRAVYDEAYFHANKEASSHDVVFVEFETIGPLTNIQFTLEKAKGEPDAAYRRAMAEYEKALAEYDEYTYNWNDVYSGNLNTILRYNDDARDENGRVLWEEVVKPNLKWLMDKYEEDFPRPPKPKKPQNKNAYYAKGKGTMFWNCSTVRNHFDSDHGVSNIVMMPFEPHSLHFEVTIYANGNGVVTFTWGTLLSYKAHLVKSAQLVDVE